MRTSPLAKLNRAGRTWLLAAATPLLLSLAGCGGGEPSGQVIATVNGTEITLAELNDEARTRNIDIAADGPTRDALLRELIDRKLLVAEARRRKLDRTPEHILGRRRWEEISLGQQLLQAAAREQGPVPPDALEKFARDNPQAFAQRAIVTVDVAALAPSIAAPLRQALAGAPDRAAMERLLADAKVQAGWSRQEWDSATPPAGLERLPVAGPFVIPLEDRLVIGAVTERRPVPLPPERRLEVARAMIERQRAEEAMTRILERARASADVSLQPEGAEVR